MNFHEILRTFFSGKISAENGHFFHGKFRGNCMRNQFKIFLEKFHGIFCGNPIFHEKKCTRNQPLGDNVSLGTKSPPGANFTPGGELCPRGVRNSKLRPILNFAPRGKL
jgi:hypothetical protein